MRIKYSLRWKIHVCHVCELTAVWPHYCMFHYPVFKVSIFIVWLICDTFTYTSKAKGLNLYSQNHTKTKIWSHMMLQYLYAQHWFHSLFFDPHLPTFSFFSFFGNIVPKLLFTYTQIIFIESCSGKIKLAHNQCMRTFSLQSTRATAVLFIFIEVLTQARLCLLYTVKDTWLFVLQKIERESFGFICWMDVEMNHRLLQLCLRNPWGSCSSRRGETKLNRYDSGSWQQFRCLLIKRQLPRWTWFTTLRGVIQQSITSRGTFKPKHHRCVLRSHATARVVVCCNS